jgi:hypothetical protein
VFAAKLVVAHDRTKYWSSPYIEGRRAEKRTTYLQRSDITMKRMPTMPSLLRTTNQTTESTSELQEQIRRRAYELYEQRGRNDGYELNDWLQAESEMARRTSNTIAA